MPSLQSCICLLLVFGLSSAFAQQVSPPQSVLFVGNSYTYFWNLPQQVETIAKEQGINMTCRQSTIGGANLGQHWRKERELQSVDLILSGKFDAVILQDHSMRVIEFPDSLQYYGGLLGELAKKQDAKVYLYMTWAREWDPYMIEPIQKEYNKLAQTLEAIIIPVGPAWAKARKLRPDLRLYDPDGSHPSNIGTYLTACVMYATLTGASPAGLPHRLISEDKDGEKLYLNILSQGDALFCQKVAEEIANSFNH